MFRSNLNKFASKETSLSESLDVLRKFVKDIKLKAIDLNLFFFQAFDANSVIQQLFLEQPSKIENIMPLVY